MAGDMIDNLTRIAKEAMARGDPAYALPLLRQIHEAERTPASLKALVEGHFQIGDDDTVIGLARHYCAQHGREAEICLWLGVAYFRRGAIEDARNALTGAAFLDFDCVYRALDLPFDGKTKDLFWRIACEALSNVNERIAQITRPCAILGSALSELSPQAEAIIDRLLDDAARGETTPPAWTIGRRIVDSDPLAARRQILMVCYGEEDETDSFARSAIWPAFHRSAVEAGYRVASFNGRDFLYHQLPPIQVAPEQRQAALMRLLAKIDDTQPDLILFDGTYLTGPVTVDQPFMDAVRATGRPLVSVLYDTDHFYDLDLNFWARNSDRVLIFAPSVTVSCAEQPERFFLWPCMPYAPSLYHPQANKDLDLTFIGKNYRARLFFLIYLRGLGIEPASLFTHKPDEPRLTYDDYARFLARAKITFNTGRLMGNSGIVTGRLIEGILSDVLVLEEIGSGAERLFQPFRHYIPFANAHQLALYARYFRKRPDRRAAIVNDAAAWYRQHLNPMRFWASLFAALNTG